MQPQVKKAIEWALGAIIIFGVIVGTFLYSLTYIWQDKERQHGAIALIVAVMMMVAGYKWFSGFMSRHKPRLKSVGKSRKAA